MGNAHLSKADLIELYAAEVAYMSNPSVPSHRNLTRLYVHDFAYAVQAGSELLIRFEREEGIITHITYRGHYCIATTAPRV